MVTILISVLGILAVFSWIIAVISAVRVVGLAPKGQKFSVYGKLGWWNFDGIRAITGPSADPHIQTYQRAFIAFMVCVLLSIVGGGLLSTVATS